MMHVARICVTCHAASIPAQDAHRFECSECYWQRSEARDEARRDEEAPDDE